MMALSRMGTAALAALLLTACSNADAPVMAETPAGAPASSPDLPPEALSFLATLSPTEIGMARLSCVRAINSAKTATDLFDPDTAARLQALQPLDQAKLINAVPGMTIDAAQAMLDATPEFRSGGPAPSADDLVGLKQCISLSAHYESELAAHSR